MVDPSRFEPESMRSKDLGGGIRLIIGKLKGQTTMTTQAVRFDKDKFTPEEARAWLKKHGYKPMSFERSEK